MSELALHNAVASYLHVMLPANAYFTTFPAGGGGRTRGGKLKRMGLKPGFPDLIVFWKSVAILFELKTAKGRLSEAQEQTHMELQRAGVFVYVCRSLADVESVLRNLHVPLRGALA